MGSGSQRSLPLRRPLAGSSAPWDSGMVGSASIGLGCSLQNAPKREALWVAGEPQGQSWRKRTVGNKTRKKASISEVLSSEPATESVLRVSNPWRFWVSRWD